MHLLIAHRDAAARAALARAITGPDDPGLEIVECGEATEALELLLREDSPRIAVVDWDLPDLDGPELCRLVRDFHLGGPPYIVLLAGSRHPNIEEGLSAGANDCIRTPARAAEIRERMDAGRRFVGVPWERVARSDGERSAATHVSGAAALQAVVSRDDDDPAWDALAGRPTGAGAAASESGGAELQAMLHES